MKSQTPCRNEKSESSLRFSCLSDKNAQNPTDLSLCLSDKKIKESRHLNYSLNLRHFASRVVSLAFRHYKDVQMAAMVRLFSLVCCFAVAFNLPADEVDLRVSGPNTLGQKVDVRLEIRGNVSAEFDGESATSLPMEVDGHFTFRERQLRSAQSTRYIREYQAATARIDYGRGQEQSVLAKGNEWIIADRRIDSEQSKRVRYLTSTGGLTQSELDLLTIPASTLVWDRMLEATKVTTGKKWSPQNELLADVLTIDKLQKNSVQLEMGQVQNGIATIHITGEATGLIDDAETEIRVQGTCDFDLTAGYTRSLRLTLQENRTICESAPGYDAVVKLEMRVSRPSADVLPQSEIETSGLDKRKWTDYLVLQNKTNEFKLRHDRRWRLITNEGQTALLRYVDGNMLLGQCTIQYLSQLPSPDAYTAEAFRRDVTKTTADQGQIADAQNFTTARGMNVMQIDVKGKVNDIEVTWRYYHVTQPDGQRLSYVVTFDTEIASRFEGVDRRLIDSVDFIRTGESRRGTINASTTLKPK